MNFTSGGVEEETLDLDRQKEIRAREWEEARKREAKLRKSFSLLDAMPVPHISTSFQSYCVLKCVLQQPEKHC
jgi:hypothetical protein